MTKLLRKYSKWILVVAASLLLVAWLVPTALDRYVNNPEKRKIMVVDGNAVTAKEFQQWNFEYSALERLLGRSGFVSTEHYMLMSRAAEKAGLVGSVSDGRAILPDLANMRAEQTLINELVQSSPELARYPTQNLRSLIQPERLAATVGMFENAYETNISQAANSQLSADEIYRALARLRGIFRLRQGYDTIAKVSTTRALQQAGRVLDSATVDYLVISADRDAEEIPAPDDATLAAHLEKYKAFKPGEGEYGLGYLLPARAKVRYLVLDRARIGAKITPDLKEMKRLFRENPDPAKPKETFEEARPRLERQYKAKVTDQILAFADQIFRTEVSLAVRQLSENPETGLKVVPAEWPGRPKLEDLAGRIVQWVEEKTRPDADTPGITIDPPAVVSQTDQFLTAADLAALPGIGSSTRLRGSKTEPFPEYVLSVRDVAPKSSLALQVGIPFDQPTKDRVGNTYYIVVTDTRTESAPASVDEARTLLTTEYKRLQAYKLLVERDMEGLKAKAIAEGLSSIDTLRPATPSNPFASSSIRSGVNVSREEVSRGDPAVDVPAFRDAVFAVQESLDPTTDVSALDASKRTFATPLPKSLSIAIGQIKSISPLTHEKLRQSERNLVQYVQNQERANAKLEDPFSLERLRKQFHVTQPGGEERTDGGEDVG